LTDFNDKNNYIYGVDSLIYFSIYRAKHNSAQVFQTHIRAYHARSGLGFFQEQAKKPKETKESNLSPPSDLSNSSDIKDTKTFTR
jgi:hypothetical protein